MTQYKSYETERLILKPTTLEDAAFVLALLNMPKWIKNIGDRNVKTLEDAKAYITNRMLPQLERLGYSNYTLIRKEDNVKIGSCGLYDREGLEGIDIGFAFFPEYEGKGYGFESANKLKNIAFSELGITEISGITIKENIASQKLLEKLGLTLQGTTTVSEDGEELLLYKIKK
jgi:RimJ/RimL family protein N-acetyltransferase